MNNRSKLQAVRAELEEARQQVIDRDVLLKKCYEQRTVDLKTIRRLRYVPGEYRCPKCKFTSSKRILRATDGAVGVDTKQYAETCPNDGEPMKRLTWQQLAEENEAFAKRLLADLHELSEIETAVNRLSPPNFKGAGEVVTLLEKVKWLIGKYHQLSIEKPVPMLLFCPECGQQHVDAPGGTNPDNGEEWTNPPHRTHSCNFCDHRWRPSDFPTTGVLTLKTKGKNDGRPGPRFVVAINNGGSLGKPESEMDER